MKTKTSIIFLLLLQVALYSQDLTGNPIQDYYNLLKQDIVLSEDVDLYKAGVYMQTSKYFELGGVVMAIITGGLVIADVVEESTTINSMFGIAAGAYVTGWTLDFKASNLLKGSKETRFKKRQLRLMEMNINNLNQ